jgi:hypothetical protein
METQIEEPTRSAETKPPTSVFILQVGRTRYYNISVEAESAEQARKAWETDEGGKEDTAECQFEYGANFQPDYEWAECEFLKGVCTPIVQSRMPRLTTIKFGQPWVWRLWKKKIRSVSSQDVF